MSEFEEVKKENKKSKGGKSKPKPMLIAEVFSGRNKEVLFYSLNFDCFFLHQGSYYKLLPQLVLEELVVEMLKEEFNQFYYVLAPSDWEGAVKALRVICMRKVSEEELAHDWIAFNDCLYNTKTHEKRPHTPEILCYKRIDVSTEDFGKPSPVFNKYLETTLVTEGNEKEELITDPELMELYQEMWGAILSGDQILNRAFFLYGGGANGKSITTELMASMFEPEFVASANLESLTKEFGKSQLVGKIINVCSEEESKYLNHDAFKVLVTGELTNFNEKYEKAGTFRNRAKFIFSSNNLPNFKGMDNAIRRRLVIIPFKRVFSEDERDHQLLEKLKDERAQIIGYALEGLKRLQKNNNQYTKAEVSEQALKELEASSNNVIRFFNEALQCNKEVEALRSSEIYPYYKRWCQNNGYKSFARDNFGKIFARIKKLSGFKLRSGGTNKYYVEVIDYDLVEDTNLPPVLPPPPSSLL